MDIEKKREVFEKWYENHKPVLLVENIIKGTARAAWQAAKAQAIPNGFVVVPKEPTREMLIAADNCEIDSKVTAHNIYKAMIAAAQEPAND